MSQAVLSPLTPVKSRLHLPFAVTIFLGAFLLFQVQPLIGKFVLPWFGGMASVWTTCMLFFQLLLLGGYLYSHWLSTRLKPRMQAAVHAGSLAVAASSIALGALLWRRPLLPSAGWRPTSPEHPLAHLLVLLTLAVGLPYLVLSSTGPLLQTWFSSTLGEKSPYRLYALSNAGSLLGLISYPVLFEPVFGLHAQAWIWCSGYTIFLACSLLCARLAARSSGAQATPPQPLSAVSGPEAQAVPSRLIQLLWFLLAALPSLMLLATTNLICQEVAVIPFLWVLPLSLYLLTLIVCFDNPKWYRREIFHALLGIVLPLAALAFVQTRPVKSVQYLIAVFCAVLFSCCMVCHGELVRLRPQPAHLTRFYLWISAGGAAGGVFVAIVAPQVFSGYWEFQAGLVGCVLLAVLVCARDKTSWWYWPPPALGLIMFLGIATVPHLYVRYVGLLVPPDAFYTFHYYGLLTFFAVGLAFWYLRERKRPATFRRFNLAQIAAVTILAGLAIALWQEIVLQRRDDVRRDRNFYGSLAILYLPQRQTRILVHGQTTHGYQVLKEPAKPTAYYGLKSGIGLLMGARPPCAGRCGLRYGVIGLGAGTLSAYGRTGEVMRFYEINPQVIGYSTGAKPYFTFVRDAAARVEVVPGDARLSLERELRDQGSQGFDVLVVDAFNSDSIPVHLLTQEAFQVYLAHLRSAESVLAFHISNNTLDLRPVLLGLALRNHLSWVRLYKNNPFDSEERSNWVLMSRNPDALALTTFRGHIAPMPASAAAVLWTDDYSNLFHVLSANRD
jgi:hypothetical protein